MPPPSPSANDEIVAVLAIGEDAVDVTDLAGDLGALGAELGVDATEPRAIVDALVALRSAAREGRDFATSDRIRDELTELGIVLEDGADGTTWHRR